MLRVNSADASCTDVGTASKLDETQAGMTFVRDASGTSETLFVASSVGALGTLDPTTFQVQVVGTFSTDIGEATLTGTPDGRLFAYAFGKGVTGAHFAEVDPSDATILSDQMVPMPAYGQGNALAFWGGDFYFFTLKDDGSQASVGRLHTDDGSFDPDYAALPGQVIMGASASTCAPL